MIAAGVTVANHDEEGDVQKLMDGYRPAFWACFVASLAVLGVVGLGMRKIEKVGLKRK